MYNGGKIIIGIIIFVLAFSSPIWTNWLSPDEAMKPNIVLPTDHKECVKDTEYMKAYHMDMLNEWRDLVVRQNVRYYDKDGEQVMLDGKRMEMSLTKTCLNCHDNKEDFCDQCHSYLDVSPYCWDCHVDKYNPIKEEECPEILNEETEVNEENVEATEEVQQ